MDALSITLWELGQSGFRPLGGYTVQNPKWRPMLKGVSDASHSSNLSDISMPIYTVCNDDYEEKDWFNDIKYLIEH